MRRGRQRGPAPLIFAEPPLPVFRRIWHLDIELPVRPVAVASSGRFPPPLWMSVPAARNRNTNAGLPRLLSKGFCGFQGSPPSVVPCQETDCPSETVRSRSIRDCPSLSASSPRERETKNERATACRLGHPMFRFRSAKSSRCLPMEPAVRFCRIRTRGAGILRSTGETDTAPNPRETPETE